MIRKYDQQLVAHKATEDVRKKQLRDYSRKLRIQAQKQESNSLAYTRAQSLGSVHIYIHLCHSLCMVLSVCFYDSSVYESYYVCISMFTNTYITYYHDSIDVLATHSDIPEPSDNPDNPDA